MSKGYINSNNSLLQPTGIHFHLHISHKAPKSMAKLICQSSGELQPAVCLSRGDGAIWRPPEHLWMSDKPQKQAIAKVALATFCYFQHQYLAELSLNAYKYHLMVKSVTCYCVQRIQLFKSSHIYWNCCDCACWQIIVVAEATDKYCFINC